jgi:hypothetical protein
MLKAATIPAIIVATIVAVIAGASSGAWAQGAFGSPSPDRGPVSPGSSASTPSPFGSDWSRTPRHNPSDAARPYRDPSRRDNSVNPRCRDSNRVDSSGRCR